MENILQCDDHQRLGYLVRIFSEYYMKGKRYEVEAWHAYFRCIAKNLVVFYQNNVPLFNDDIENYENEETDSIFIHGNLHIGQFQYYLHDVTNEPIFNVRPHKKISASFTRDLKRLATNLALIAFCQGFNNCEMIEIVDLFTRQYIMSLISTKQNYRRRNSIENDRSWQKETCRFRKQCSIVGSLKVEYEMHPIHWQSIDNVKVFMILAEQLAMSTADLHCRQPFTDLEKKNDIETIRTVLSTAVQQQHLIDDLP